MTLSGQLRSGVILLAAAFVLLYGCRTALRAGSSGSEPSFDLEVLPYFRQHCFGCHGERVQRGGFRIDTLSRDFVNGPIDRWREVIDRLGSAEMPPVGQPNRPSAEETGRVVEWLASRIAEGDAARLAKRERVSFHRLTREEYRNSVFDLLGVQFDVEGPAGLNEDDTWRGFERIGSVLSLSPSHVEKYFAAAESILAEAYPEETPRPVTVRESALELAGGTEAYGVDDIEELDLRVDLWPGQVVRVDPAGAWIESAGRYRIRAQLSGLRSAGGRAPHLTMVASSIDRLLFERDIVTPEGEPIVVEFDAHLPAGRHEFTVTNDSPGPLILSRLGRSGRPFTSLEEGRIPWQVQLTDETGAPIYPLLILDWVEWSGPIGTDTASVREDYLKREVDDLERAADGIAKFAERAFRRPLEPGEIARYMQIAEGELAAGEDISSAVKTSMLAVLCSVDFLYLAEGSPELEADTLSDWQLASRLSYFLWGTMPDEELLELARDGTIGQGEVLHAQVVRMLADPRVDRFVSAFSRQWLQLNKVGMFPPDSELYPEYDEHLERSMVGETTAFFKEVLKQNLTLREFLMSDWTVVNPRLALHYGIPGITEDRFQIVSLEANQHRGGVLTHASVLSLTSDGARHRPVHRGVWVSESIFGQSPPPPPASVEPIEPIAADAAKATFRMQLEAHRTDPNCASCHRKIDPLGLAFDNYDAIGRWRTEETVPTGMGSNPQVDASGTLFDGRSFSNPGQFQQLLVDDIDRFNEAFVEKLATFALRRAMTVSDRTELASIAAESAAHDYRLSDLVQALVLSDLFKER